MSGEVKTYKTHERLTWEQFKALPDDLAAEHIKYLVDTFGANVSYIAVALGVCNRTVALYLREHGIQVKQCRFVTTPEWFEFLYGPNEPAPADPVAEEPVPIVTVKPAVAEPKMMAPAVHSVAFMRGSLVLSGPKGAVLQRLFEVLPDTVAVNVEFTAEEA